MRKNLMWLLLVFPIGSTFAMTAPDNAKVNLRDRNEKEITADQQMNGADDLSITRRIRQNILKEKNFSTYAQNVKIITLNGKVTLKGPVRSEAERSSILNYARLIVSPSQVTNEMSVVALKK